MSSKKNSLDLFSDSFLSKGYIIFLILVIVLTLVGRIVYALLTPFTKEITIKEKFIKRGTGRSGYDIYHLVDSNDNIYQIRDVWFKGEFDTADDYVKIKEGKTYKVVGYGSRVRMLSWYPILYKFTEV